MGRKVYTPVFRASFAHVFTPRLNQLSGKEEYSVKMIFDKDANFTDMTAIVQEAIQEKWGTNPPKNIKLPFKDGNQGDTDKYPEDKDKIICTAKTMIAPPGVVNRQCQPIMDPKEIYSGCYMIATVTAYAYDNIAKGVAFGLQNLMKWEDGEPLVSRASAEDDFAKFSGAAENAENILGI